MSDWVCNRCTRGDHSNCKGHGCSCAADWRLALTHDKALIEERLPGMGETYGLTQKRPGGDRIVVVGDTAYQVAGEVAEAIEAEAATRRSTALEAAAHELLAALGQISGTITGRDRLDAAETHLKVLLAGDKAEPNPRLGGPYLDDRTDLDGPLSAEDKAEAPE